MRSASVAREPSRISARPGERAPPSLAGEGRLAREQPGFRLDRVTWEPNEAHTQSAHFRRVRR